MPPSRSHTVRHRLPLRAIVATTIILSAACNTPTSSEGRDVSSALNEAYSSQDPAKMEAFLEEWKQASVPATAESRALMSDTVQAVYDIFEEFWDPTQLNNYGENRLPVLGNFYYAQVHYAVVPGTMLYRVSTLGAYASIVRDFRPRLSIDGMTTLYLTPEYQAGLQSFLGSATFSPVTDRSNFLNSYIGSIMAPYRTGPWFVATFPLVREITFTEGLTGAHVYYRIGYEGGHAFFDNNGGGNWEQRFARMTWLEFPPGTFGM